MWNIWNFRLIYGKKSHTSWCRSYYLSFSTYYIHTYSTSWEHNLVLTPTFQIVGKWKTAKNVKLVILHKKKNTY